MSTRSGKVHGSMMSKATHKFKNVNVWSIMPPKFAVVNKVPAATAISEDYGKNLDRDY